MPEQDGSYDDELSKMGLKWLFFQVCYETQKQNGTKEAKSCSLLQEKRINTEILPH